MLGDPKYALKEELNNYLSKTDANNNYASKRLGDSNICI